MYAKMFSSVIHSSLWAEDPPTKVLFMTMMALADREGYVYASAPGLAHAAYLEPEQCRKSLEILMSPDPNSSDVLRNPENDGKRVEAIDGGWRLVNYSYYRDLQDEDERRHQDKMRKRKQRSRLVTGGHGSSGSVPPSHASESESSQSQSQNKRKTVRAFKKPTLEEVRAYVAEKGMSVNPELWFAHYEANGWKVGENSMKKWKAAIWTWELQKK